MTGERQDGKRTERQLSERQPEIIREVGHKVGGLVALQDALESPHSEEMPPLSAPLARRWLGMMLTDEDTSTFNFAEPAPLVHALFEAHPPLRQKKESLDYEAAFTQLFKGATTEEIAERNHSTASSIYQSLFNFIKKSKENWQEGTSIALLLGNPLPPRSDVENVIPQHTPIKPAKPRIRSRRTPVLVKVEHLEVAERAVLEQPTTPPVVHVSETRERRERLKSEERQVVGHTAARAIAFGPSKHARSIDFTEPTPAQPDRPFQTGAKNFTKPVIDENEKLAWQNDSVCSETDPEAFFPEKGGSTKDAKKICADCEVRIICLEYALENDERFGIWGGLSERERRKLRKQREEKQREKETIGQQAS